MFYLDPESAQQVLQQILKKYGTQKKAMPQAQPVPVQAQQPQSFSPGSQFDNPQMSSGDHGDLYRQAFMQSMNPGLQALTGAAQGFQSSMRGIGQGLAQTVQGFNPGVQQSPGERIGNIAGGVQGMLGGAALSPVSIGMGAMQAVPGLKPVADAISATPEILQRGLQGMYGGESGPTQNPIVGQFQEGAKMLNQSFSPVRQMIDKYGEKTGLNKAARGVMQSSQPSQNGAMGEAINTLIPPGAGHDVAQNAGDFMKTGGAPIAGTAASLAYYRTLGKAAQGAVAGAQKALQPNPQSLTEASGQGPVEKNFNPNQDPLKFDPSQDRRSQENENIASGAEDSISSKLTPKEFNSAAKIALKFDTVKKFTNYIKSLTNNSDANGPEMAAAARLTDKINQQYGSLEKFYKAAQPEAQLKQATQDLFGNIKKK